MTCSGDYSDRRRLCTADGGARGGLQRRSRTATLLARPSRCEWADPIQTVRVRELTLRREALWQARAGRRCGGRGVAFRAPACARDRRWAVSWGW